MGTWRLLRRNRLLENECDLKSEKKEKVFKSLQNTLERLKCSARVGNSCCWFVFALVFGFLLFFFLGRRAAAVAAALADLPFLCVASVSQTV